MATYCFSFAAILAVTVMYSSSCVITHDQQVKIADTQTLGLENTSSGIYLYIPNLCPRPRSQAL